MSPLWVWTSHFRGLNCKNEYFITESPSNHADWEIKLTMEVDTSCLQNLTTQKSFFSIPCHQSSILSYQLTSCINSEDEKQQHKEKEIRSIDGKGMGFWKTEKTNEIKSECLYLRLEQQAELKTPQISWRLQGLIISSFFHWLYGTFAVSFGSTTVKRKDSTNKFKISHSKDLLMKVYTWHSCKYNTLWRVTLIFCFSFN